MKILIIISKFVNYTSNYNNKSLGRLSTALKRAWWIARDMTT